MKKICQIDPEKICNECNMCNICDLDPNKLCDSCGKCLGIDEYDYREVRVEGLLEIENDSEIDEYILDSDTYNYHSHQSHDDDCSCCSEIGFNVDYIEDIPELKIKYDKEIRDILNGKE